MELEVKILLAEVADSNGDSHWSGDAQSELLATP